MKIEAHTIRFGNPEWLYFCSRSLDAWCSRHEIPLKIWDKSNIDPTYPADKFCEVDMLKEFLAGDNDWMFYIDADVWVDYEAGVPDLKPGLTICPDRMCKWIRQWPDWCRETFKDQDVDAILDNKVYYNAGIWMIDRRGAEILLSCISEPYYDRCQEQDQFNWWLALAKDKGMIINDLPRKWNMYPQEVEPASFHHLAGPRKFEKSLPKVKRGLIPHVPEPFVVPEFGTDERAIVIPWKRDRSRWEELRYALRSIEENFEDKDCPIYILGDFIPSWYDFRIDTRVKFIPTCLYQEALVKGVTLAEKILWTNDDIVFLKPVGWEHFDQAVHLGELSLETGMSFMNDRSSTEWRRGLGRSVVSLHRTLPGKTIRHFSTHTPYLYERDKALEVLKLYGLFHKVPMETLYHNHWQTPAVPIGTQKGVSLPDDEAFFLNYRDETLTPDLMDSLVQRFPERMKWEIRV